MVLALVVAVLCLWGRLSAANPEAKRLYDDLLSNYNRLIRPVGNNSDRLTVKMGLRLSQLIDVYMAVSGEPPTHLTKPLSAATQIDSPTAPPRLNQPSES
ncbi:unnamed protein product [Plutella xylostella]|uniref:(diamondback moth) hypothetical protein n=1 Tax=Plutella xylostella TaxID=51655 RepID=A0A8S4FPB4_PLUXY|nr:unnamed protein product [Plutella xylostella]